MKGDENNAMQQRQIFIIQLNKLQLKISYTNLYHFDLPKIYARM